MCNYTTTIAIYANHFDVSICFRPYYVRYLWEGARECEVCIEDKFWLLSAEMVLLRGQDKTASLEHTKKLPDQQRAKKSETSECVNIFKGGRKHIVR